jgi:glycine cleavage system aminomethyltransferase T
MEAGLCLYGNYLDEMMMPIEWALGWTMGGLNSHQRKEQGFIGASKILTPEGKLKPVSCKRVGSLG